MEKQKYDDNPMPEFKLFRPLEALKKFGHLILDQFRDEGLSDHFHHDPEVSVSTDCEVGPLPNRWDDMGNYYD